MMTTSWPCIFIARPNPCVTSPNPPTFASGANSAVTCAIFFGLFVSSVAVFPSKSSSGSFFGLVSQNGFLSSSPTGHPSAVIGNGHSISDSLLGSVRSAPTAAFFVVFIVVVVVVVDFEEFEEEEDKEEEGKETSSNCICNIFNFAFSAFNFSISSNNSSLVAVAPLLLFLSSSSLLLPLLLLLAAAATRTQPNLLLSFLLSSLALIFFIIIIITTVR
mmetsp:Transcript_8904/g.29118  ORF Transcript_8904/g.29118 Transcript_8904/m.29118 type:complete len:218 (+) Transcript_8904:1389-2042(+)